MASSPHHLPPRHLWPERRPGGYPDTFNCTEFLLDRHVHSGRPALLAGDDALSYADLLEQVGRLGNALRALGTRAGDRVLIRSLNEPPALLANFAALRIGATVVPTSPLLDADQFRHIARDCAPTVIVVSAPLADAVIAARAELPGVRHVIVYGSPAPPGCVSFDELLTGHEPELAPVARAATDIAVLLYSSGLTRPPMATAHQQDELLIIPDGYGRHGWQVTSDDVIAGAGPISFAGGYSTILAIPFRFGATAAIIPLTTTPAQMFPIIRRYGVTLLAALPTRYGEMLDVPGADPTDLATLRMVSAGGEPLPPAVAGGWRKRFGLEVYEGFGTNGMMHVFITTAVSRTVKPGVMGRPLPGYQVRVLDEDGIAVGRNELGQLHVRGPVGTLCWGHPDAAAEVEAAQAATMRDGWVRIGDWVRQDADGDLTFVAREEDIVHRRDVTFGPVEVERALTEHPAVAETGVFASGGHVTALVVPAAGVEPSAELITDILATARVHLGAARMPDELRIVPRLPRTRFGTLLRRCRWPAWLADTDHDNRGDHHGRAVLGATRA